MCCERGVFLEGEGYGFLEGGERNTLFGVLFVQLRAELLERGGVGSVVVCDVLGYGL